MDRLAILVALGSWAMTLTGGAIVGPSDQREAYFNGTAYIRMANPINFHSHVGISFRSCSGGEIFTQQLSSTHSIRLYVFPDHVSLLFNRTGGSIEARLSLDNPLDNRWHYIEIVYHAPNLWMNDDTGHAIIVANDTYHSEILNSPEFDDDDNLLIIGNRFVGCMLEGPNLVFNSSLIMPHNVRFGKCPLVTDKCVDKRDVLAVIPVDHCFNEPCMRHGICISKPDKYECRCSFRYAGNNCQIDNGPPCSLKLCNNGGTCNETKDGNYTCLCTSGYYGTNCQFEVSNHPLCAHNSPCQNNATCKILPTGDDYQCICKPGFIGRDCEVNVNECLTGSQPACHNDGICEDGIDSFTCNCTNTGYTGEFCEININECAEVPNLCLNGGVCFDIYGSYVCHCQPGFTGDNCELNQNECLSSPCLNGGTCEDLVGTYKCNCPRGTDGPRCTSRRSVRCVDTDCPPHSTCANNSAVTAICICNPGYVGNPGPYPNCTLSSGTDCYNNNPCSSGSTCNYDVYNNVFNCICPPNFTGTFCEQPMLASEIGPSLRSEMAKRCSDLPCVHAKSCEDNPGGYICKCEPGWTGVDCDKIINECLSNPCQNGGECTLFMNSFECNCAPGFTGRTCQTPIDLCSIRPCQNGGICRNTKSNTNFLCECPTGFRGQFCEENIDDCVNITCPEHQVCFDGINTYECRCPDGFTGENCTMPTNFCASNPCINGTCKEGGGGNNYTCTCHSGYTGQNCDTDIDECAVFGICNLGICRNNPGSFECYCKPGFTGEHCEIDFDECLSRPCRNNGSCINEINNYKCICTPGFTGKDCSLNINECESDPCKEGSTCVDGMATFTCLCKQGFTGLLCDINIDDCESMPCLNGGICEDGLNSFTCNCTDTGYNGTQCENNIDECASDPCMHGSTCRDLIKDYECDCHPGYTGKNCQIDIQECQSSPCQYHGICLERSNVSLYQNAPYDPMNPLYINPELNMLLPLHFYQEFSYENASGFECVCINGITGRHCEININDCESSPCGPWGTCVDKVGRYDCECEDGFEGDDCRKDIDECVRYKPCFKGICHDRRANYFCECEPGWGGKNCSVVLRGCATNQCLNNGTCLPWLQNETEHKFNCTCKPGFHGDTCEKITTMSLGGHGYIVVNNTARDEGYDIQFQFKTTLGNGLLAMGKGYTYYILKLVNGRLNLHSSLLNKWEGVFIGGQLNDSKWHRIFVAINTSHVALSADREQTIYPISINDASNSSYTSFPTTYIGGTIKEYNRLTHGFAAFVGCIEDVVINSEWVLPDDSPSSIENLSIVDPKPVVLSSQSASWELLNIQTQCPRVEQCGSKNPCHSGGQCTDLWTSFHCSCQRPYLGHTCQYNFTAATFGHENISDSYVTVLVNDTARRAVRTIVDISMFIRTRKPSGQIFYLGSKPRGTSDETFIAAFLENGGLSIRLQFNQPSEVHAVGGNRLDNGYNHLIQIVRNSTLVQVKLNGSEYFRKSISFAGPLEAQILYLGGQPINLYPSRTIRQAEVLSSSAINSGLPIVNGNLRAEPTISSGFYNYPHIDNFKGVIQDVQISNGTRTMIVEIFPLEVPGLDMPLSFGTVSFDNNTVLEGVISDDSCVNNPCQHNGTCEITWNDFSCKCPRGYKGKSCQEMEFCQLQDCPLGSVCRNLNDGYECIANATFDGHNTTLSYNLSLIKSDMGVEEKLSANSITIQYRSKTGGTLLHIENSEVGEMVSISVFRDQVAVAWRLGPLQIPKVKRFRKSQPDFQWTRIHLIISKDLIKGGFGDWSDDDSPSFTSEFDGNAWIDLLKSGDIHIGGVRSLKENAIDAHAGVVSGNPYLLRNFTPNERSRSFDTKNLYMVDNSNFGNEENKRVDYQSDGLLNSNNVDLLGFDVPFSTESGTVDPEFWMGSEGTVGENFKGCIGEVRIGDLLLPFYTLLELYPNTSLPQLKRYHFSLQNKLEKDALPGCVICFTKECFNGGVCLEPETNYTCTCPAGFAGDNCEIDIDECANSHCHNNSTCVDGIGNYTCICQTGWDGWLCDIDIDECASHPCKNAGTCTDLPGKYACICPEEFTGVNCGFPVLRTCVHEPCKAGSTCLNQKDTITGNNFTCECMPGFEGDLCDVPYCSVKPCINGGRCESLPDSAPVCKCPPGYKGRFCEENIDECHLVDGSSPCLHGGRCIDEIASYKCDCYDTGYTGYNCEVDINECNENTICGDGGTCVNTDGSYDCLCSADKCGNNCSLPDPCSEIRYHGKNEIVTDLGNEIISEAYVNTSTDRGPCENGGQCRPKCKIIADYECLCINGWGGKNCTERPVVAADEEGAPIGIIVGAIVGGLCGLGGIGLVVACMLARSKRATRGTYSPSGQEYRNPRLEMLDSVLKPPPEERLI